MIATFVFFEYLPYRFGGNALFSEIIGNEKFSYGPINRSAAFGILIQQRKARKLIICIDKICKPAFSVK